MLDTFIKYNTESLRPVMKAEPLGGGRAAGPHGSNLELEPRPFPHESLFSDPCLPLTAFPLMPCPKFGCITFLMIWTAEIRLATYAGFIKSFGYTNEQ